jgi:hypothetical protein
MKPNYEKPIAVTLGEAAKGCGQCNAGSAVKGGVGIEGHCDSGYGADVSCFGGIDAALHCQPGGSPGIVYCTGGMYDY